MRPVSVSGRRKRRSCLFWKHVTTIIACRLARGCLQPYHTMAHERRKQLAGLYLRALSAAERILQFRNFKGKVTRKISTSPPLSVSRQGWKPPNHQLDNSSTHTSTPFPDTVDTKIALSGFAQAVPAPRYAESFHPLPPGAVLTPSFRRQPDRILSLVSKAPKYRSPFDRVVSYEVGGQNSHSSYLLDAAPFPPARAKGCF